jgi:hypothetical protein
VETHRLLLPVLVIVGPQVRIAQDLVGLSNRLELCASIRVGQVLVRVELDRKLSIGLLELDVRRYKDPIKNSGVSFEGQRRRRAVEEKGDCVVERYASRKGDREEQGLEERERGRGIPVGETSRMS